jgi:uncharacterized protein with von Willebrand factor type A (vWA) domain
LIKKAVKQKWISKPLMKKINDYRSIIRNETAHAKTPVHYLNLGLRYNKEGGTGVEEIKNQLQ